MRPTKILITLVCVFILFALSQSSQFKYLNSLSTELSLALRSLVTPVVRQTPSDSSVVVVAIDELTYATPPFSGTPKVMWTPQFAQVQDAILSAGAKVVGYDIIFPTSVEKFIPGYEREFLRSLAKWGRQGKLVLGQAQHSDNPIAPYQAQLLVTGGGRNLRALNLDVDSDEVTRRLPLSFKTTQGDPIPSFSLELAMRAGVTKLELLENGSVKRDEKLIPGSERQQTYLNFYKGSETPTLSFADLYQCANAGNTEFFESQFKDKVVLFGLVLDLEDRKLTSKRLFNSDADFLPAARCTGSTGDTATEHSSIADRDTLPGVYIHAKSVNDLLNGTSLSPIADTQANILIGLMLITGAAIGLMSSPLIGSLIILSLIGLILIADQWILGQQVFIPSLPMLVALVSSYIIIALVEYTFTRRKQAKTRKLFALYLDKAVIDKMLKSDEAPELGGEKREVSIWFSDVADFTSISEGLTPHKLVEVMNIYFTAVTRLIEEHGGFVDKYIGDAIVGVFGAPLSDPHHAGHAVSCALQAQRLLDKMNREGVFGDITLNTRIGINTGEVLVGNIGSEGRFNYTVMGDEVNLASRLEGVNKVFGSEILIAGSTADKLPKSILTRPLMRLRVKGKSEAVKVAEPIDMRSWNKPVFLNPKGVNTHPNKSKLSEPVPSNPSFEASQQTADAFARAYDAWQLGQLDEARTLYQQFSTDTVAQHMLQLLEKKASDAKAGNFDPVLKLDSK